MVSVAQDVVFRAPNAAAGLMIPREDTAPKPLSSLGAGVPQCSQLMLQDFPAVHTEVFIWVCSVNTPIPCDLGNS